VTDSALSIRRALRRALGAAFVVILVSVVALYYYIPPLRFIAEGHLQNFDFGILLHSTNLLAIGEQAFLTNRGVHVWADNQDYLQILFTPIHWTADPIRSLVLLHTSGIFAVGLLLLWTLRKQPFIALMLALFYWLNPIVANMNLDLVHTEAFSTLLLLIVFLSAKKGFLAVFWFFALLALLTKEDVAVTLGAFAVLARFAAVEFELNKRQFDLLLALSLVVFAVNFFIVLPHFKLETCRWLDPTVVSLERDFAPASPFFRAAFSGFLSVEFYQRVFVREELVGYLLKVLWPLLLIALRPNLFMLLPLPGILLNIISGSNYLIQGLYHYDHATLAGVLIALLVSMPKLRFKGVVSFALFAISLSLNLYQPVDVRQRISDLAEPWFFELQDRPRTALLKELQNTIPKGTVISADYAFISYLLPSRTSVFAYPNPIESSYFGIYGLCEEFATRPEVDLFVIHPERLGAFLSTEEFADRRSLRHCILGREEHEIYLYYQPESEVANTVHRLGCPQAGSSK